MPSANNPLFTALDVEKQMVALLNADPIVQAAIVNPNNVFVPVVRYDPTKVDKLTGTLAVFTLVAEDPVDATLGGIGGGTEEIACTFGLVVYVYEGQNRTLEGHDALVQATAIMRRSVMRYRQGVSDGSDNVAAGTQLWNRSKFHRAGGSATTYMTPKDYRRSVTFVDLFSRFPFA